MTTEPSPDPRDVIATLLRRRFDGIGWSAAEFLADALLAAIETNPAVADAIVAGRTEPLLAALTRAGALEEDHKGTCRFCGVNYGDMHPRDCAFSLGSRPRWKPMRRLVTPWREATS